MIDPTLNNYFTQAKTFVNENPLNHNIKQNASQTRADIGSARVMVPGG
jgi:hypothetical protein